MPERENWIALAGSKKPGYRSLVVPADFDCMSTYVYRWVGANRALNPNPKIRI